MLTPAQMKQYQDDGYLVINDPDPDDPDSIQQRSVEEDVIARLRALPQAPRGTLLEKFVLMLDATDAMLPSARQRPMLVRPAA